jgi:hypothetical protein
MRPRPDAVMALAGWVMVTAGLWAGVSLPAALVVGGSLLLAAAMVRVKA